MRKKYFELIEVKNILSKRDNQFKENVEFSYNDISNYIKITNLWASLFSFDGIKNDVIYITNLILMNYPENINEKKELDQEMFNFMQSIDFYPHMNTNFKLTNITSF